jgi:hypothetical protein
VGSKRFMDFTLIGDTVNVASRLCHAALAGQILITETTFLPARRHVEILNAEPLVVKGKREPVRTYAVAGYIEDVEAERRQHLRREAQLDILVKVAELDDTYQKVLVNISAGGFRMVGKRWIKPQSEILATIPLPTGVRIKDAPGVVLSCENTRESLVETRVSFRGLPERDRDEIVKFVYKDYTV